MEFLQNDGRPKVVRTVLYNDQEFSRWELELLHTPVVQRLYQLKQLGFTDKVFPDAVHSRFNHVLGVADVAERMARKLTRWLTSSDLSFEYANDQLDDDRRRINTISARDLAAHVESHIEAVRTLGLLHDLTHGAFGHTLEDEVCVFEEKHDDPPRQVRFFDALVVQLLFIWAVELGVREADPNVLDDLTRLDATQDLAVKLTEELAERLSAEHRRLLVAHLQELDFACRLLLRIEFLHKQDQRQVPQEPALIVSTVVRTLSHQEPGYDVFVHRDAFFVDIVGNTICADLLDYARRDACNAGIKVQFDDRFIRYLTVVSVRDKLSPTGDPCIRIAVQFFTDKMRHDVLSEMSGILKARYLLHERVLFHPTKCAAGAMLGAAVQLLGLKKLPPWVQALGDQEFLRLLTEAASNMNLVCEKLKESAAADPAELATSMWPASPRMRELIVGCLEAMHREPDDVMLLRVIGARQLLWRLSARRFPKLVFRLRVNLNHSAGENDSELAARYSDAVHRYQLERKVERMTNLPFGSLVIHCPRRKTGMKIAQALVVGADPRQVAHLRDVTNVCPEGLQPYQDEIRAVEAMYRSIWQFHAYLDVAHLRKHSAVAWVLQRELRFPNDRLLAQEFRDEPRGPYDVLLHDFGDDFAPARFPIIIKKLDHGLSMRQRHGGSPDFTQMIRGIIREVNASVEDIEDMASNDGSAVSEQMTLPGVKKGRR